MNSTDLELLSSQLPWYFAGPLLGVLVVLGYWASNAALGGVGAFAALQQYLARPGAGATWRLYFLLGLAGGGALFALLSGGWAPGSFAYGSFDDGRLGAEPLTKAIALTGGGLLMGLGAKHASGCTLGHGLCGSATLSPASLVSTLTFMGVAVAVAHLLLAAGVLG